MPLNKRFKDVIHRYITVSGVFHMKRLVLNISFRHINHQHMF